MRSLYARGSAGIGQAADAKADKELTVIIGDMEKRDVHIAGELIGLFIVAPILFAIALRSGPGGLSSGERKILGLIALGTAAVDGWLLWKYAQESRGI